MYSTLGGSGKAGAPPPFPGQPVGGPPGAGGVMNSPFGMGGGAGGGVAVRSSPFAGPGGVAPPSAPGSHMGSGGPAGLAPPPMAGSHLAPPPMAGTTQPFGGACAAQPSGPAAPPPAGSCGGFSQSHGTPHSGGYNATGYPAQSGFGAQPGPDVRMASIARDIEQSNPPSIFVRGTVGKMPLSASTKTKASLPVGVVFQPLAEPPVDMEPVPSVNFSGVGTIVRCKDCRTYINPFVAWESNGRRWTCNLCAASQAIPDAYYCSLDGEGKRVDRHERAELSKGNVEYIAPGEYMVRPPQAPVYMFVIDVSYTALVTGMLDSVISGIKEAIQSKRIPGGSRTQVGIMTFDTALHFYNLNPSLSTPQIFVVADLEDIFLPLPDDILVNLSDSEAAVTSLLDSIPQIYASTKNNESCMGSAIKGAYMAMKHIGGKLLVFGACIPSVGELALKSTRENNHVLGTDREVELLRPVNEGYKNLATELTKVQISVEMFIAPQAYVDLASIAQLAKFTAGDVHYYPQFHISHSGMKLKSELIHVLTRYTGWEAVMRIRVSRGWKITKFFGHLFIKGTDLLVVPNCHSDQTFTISLELEENVTPDPILCVQSALLYTNSDGERRIRVQTWAATTTQNHTEIIQSADVQAVAAILSHGALEHSLRTTLKEGRDRLTSQCQQIVQAANSCPNAEALQFLPLYIVGMLKSAGFRATNDVPVDLRTYLWSRLESLSVAQLSAYYYPRMLPLHNLEDDVGILDEAGCCRLPDMLNLTCESMTQDGVYLLEDGEAMHMWLGSAVNPNLLQACFGVQSLEHLDPNMAEAALAAQNNPLSTRVTNIINQVRSERDATYMMLHVHRHNDPKAARFFASLIEDRTAALQSTYTEFLQRMGYRPQQASQAPPVMGAPPPMMGGPQPQHMPPGGMGGHMTTPPIRR